MSSSQLTWTPSFLRGVGLNHQPAIVYMIHLGANATCPTDGYHRCGTGGHQRWRLAAVAGSRPGAARDGGEVQRWWGLNLKLMENDGKMMGKRETLIWKQWEYDQKNDGNMVRFDDWSLFKTSLLVACIMPSYIPIDIPWNPYYLQLSSGYRVIIPTFGSYDFRILFHYSIIYYFTYLIVVYALFIVALWPKEFRLLDDISPII